MNLFHSMRSLIALLLWCCVTTAPADETSTSGDPPNIIFIMADDLGYGDLGCYGQAEIQTPHIDRLASEGMKFNHCYSGSTVCAPSRCSLLTGMHMGHARIRGNDGWVGPQRTRRSELPLLDRDVTIAEVLKAAGYATGATGKWGVGQPGSSGVPTKQGFDEFLGFLNQVHAHGYYPEYLWRNDQMISINGNLGGFQRDWVHDRMTDFSLDFIQQHYENPFFLYVAYTVPHGRYEVPSDQPYSDEAWPEAVRNYAAMVTHMDNDVGKMLALLKELDIDENTIVMVTSDNGAEIYYTNQLGITKQYDEILQSRGGLTGWKRDLTDGGIRVPLVARWPGQIKAGTESDHICALYDMMPTFAELAGASAPGDVDGISIVPTLMGETQAPHEYLYWEFFERGFQQAVRFGPYKALRLKAGQPIELYDVLKDPGESNDLAAENPMIVVKAAEFMDEARRPSPNWPK